MRKLTVLLLCALCFAMQACGQGGGAEQRYVLKVHDRSFELVLNNSPAARAFAETLPVEFAMQRWGDQYAGPSPVRLEAYSEAVMDMQIGHFAYWPQGKALCILFGPTPMAPGPSPQLYAPGVVLGHIEGDLNQLRGLDAEVLVVVYAY